MSQDISRRNFIRNGTTGAAAVGVAGLAGCTSSLPFIGDDASFEGDAWLFVPSYSDVQDLGPIVEDRSDREDPELEDAELYGRDFDYVVPEEILDNEEEIDGNDKLTIGSLSRERFGVPAPEADWSLTQSIEWRLEYTYTREQYDGTTTEEGEDNTTVDVDVHSGSFETDDVVDALEHWVENELADPTADDDPELESNGHQADFDRYEVDDYAFGVHEDYLIQVDADAGAGTDYVDPTAVLEAAIDARENDEDLWVDDEDGEALLEHVEDGDAIEGKLYTPKTAEAQLEEEYGEEFVDEMDDDDFEEAAEIIVEERGYDDWEIGLVGDAESKDVDGDETDIHEVYLYETEQDVDREAFSDAVETERGYADEWEFLEDYSIEVDGRVIILTGTQRTRSAFD